MADVQPDYSGSCMIALYPPPEVAGTLAVRDGLGAEGMHVTIAYTGAAADVDPEALNAAAKALASRPPFTAVISGHARFTGGTKDCIVALVDAPELETLRADARAALDGQGISIPSEHGFTAHLSILYLGEDEPDPVGRLAPFPVTFGAVSVMHGKDRTDYPFSDDLPALAREAYLSGWALTGAPLTERIRTGCAAAVAAALEHADDPAVLEVTLELGKLEGAWAIICRRREKLLRKHVNAVTAAWKACTADLDARGMVRRFRRDIYLPAEAVTRDPTKKWWQDTAIAAALGWLRGIYRADGYDALVAALEDAIREGMAEGEAGALALAASRQGKTGFRIDDAFKAAYERLADDHTITQRARDAATRIVDGTAGDTGRRLAGMAGDDSGEDDMAGAADGIVTGDDVSAVDRWTDWAVYAAIGAGTLALYALAGVQFCDWNDAGDSRECPTCAANAAGSPYALAGLPEYPGHIRCRCSISTSGRIPLSFLAAFLN